MKSTNRLRHLPTLILFIFFIGVWYLISMVILPPYKQFLLPRPDVVITDGFLVWNKGDQRGMRTVLQSLWHTTQIAVLGLLITTILGTMLALLMSFSKWIEKATWPYLVALQAAPVIALTPLIRALIDSPTTQRLLVVALIAFFPITSATLFGLTTVPRELHDLFTIHKATRRVRLLKLQVPHCLPSFFLGLRTSAGLAVVGAIVGDFYFRRGGNVGIGAQIDLYRAQLWGPELIVAVIMASALGIILFLIFSWISHAVVGRWHNSSRS